MGITWYNMGNYKLYKPYPYYTHITPISLLGGGDSDSSWLEFTGKIRGLWSDLKLRDPSQNMKVEWLHHPKSVLGDSDLELSQCSCDFFLDHSRRKSTMLVPCINREVPCSHWSDNVKTGTIRVRTFFIDEHGCMQIVHGFIPNSTQSVMVWPRISTLQRKILFICGNLRSSINQPC